MGVPVNFRWTHLPLRGGGVVLRVAGFLILISMISAFGAWSAVRTAKLVMGPPPIEAAEAMSRSVVDRNGRLLRAFTTPRRPLAVARGAGRGRSTLSQDAHGL